YSINADINFDLCIGELTPATNDECVGAIAIPASGTINGANYSTTESLPSVLCEGNTSTEANDVWYSFTPDASGTINIEVTDNYMDIVAEVFSGTCGSMTSINCTDDDGPISMTVNAQETYLLRVYGYGGQTGPFTINIGGLPLPINTTNLSGKLVNQLPVLSWTTYQEQNNRGFELQRSLDGKTFSSIAYIPSKAAEGNSTSALNYQFEDDYKISSEVFYRYIQHDFDGRTTQSNVVRLNTPTNTAFEVITYPNPTTGKAQLIINGLRADNSRVIITDAVGRDIKTIPVESNEMNIDMSELPAGLYFIKYMDKEHQRVLKITKK